MMAVILSGAKNLATEKRNHRCESRMLRLSAQHDKSSKQVYQSISISVSIYQVSQLCVFFLKNLREALTGPGFGFMIRARWNFLSRERCDAWNSLICLARLVKKCSAIRRSEAA
jgi:hypothetical protein